MFVEESGELFVLLHGVVGHKHVRGQLDLHCPFLAGSDGLVLGDLPLRASGHHHGIELNLGAVHAGYVGVVLFVDDAVGLVVENQSYPILLVPLVRVVL